MDSEHTMRTKDHERTIVSLRERDEAAQSPGAGDRKDNSERAHFRVEDVRVGETDSRGELIDVIFYKRPQYAIYLSKGQVVVQYSDDQHQASEQIGLIA